MILETSKSSNTRRQSGRGQDEAGNGDNLLGKNMIYKYIRQISSMSRWSEQGIYSPLRYAFSWTS